MYWSVCVMGFIGEKCQGDLRGWVSITDLQQTHYMHRLTHTGACCAWILHYMLIHSFRVCHVRSERVCGVVLGGFFESAAKKPQIHPHICSVLTLSWHQT